MTLDKSAFTEEIIERSRRDTVQQLPVVKDGRVYNHGGLTLDRVSRGAILPAYGTRERERELLRLYRHDYNNLFRSAVGVLTKQVQSTPWELKGEPAQTDYFQDVLLKADFGQGFESFLSKLIVDWSRYDSGAYIELVGPGDPLEPISGPISTITVLDSVRCWPTGDPEFPVIYYDILGAMHVLHYTRVVRFYDMPDSTENTYGYAYGECAMSRGIGAVSREILINRYTEQVLDDNPPPGILIFKNVSDKNLRDAIAKLEQERATDFGSRWGDTIRLYGLDTDKLPEVESVQYSNPPEGFDYEAMKNLNAKEIAAAVGVDIQDFWELTQSNMGTATQSAVLHEKSKGKALGRILKSLERVINQALPESLQFEFKYRDDQEDQAEATKAQTWIANASQLAQLPNIPSDAIARLLVNQVPAIRDVMTDESGEIIRLPDDDPKSGEQVELSTQATVESAETQTTPQDATTIDDTEKALRDTRQSFEDIFVRLVNQTNLSDAGSRALVGQILRQQLQSHGEDVWLDGQRAGGNETAVIDKEAERAIAVWRSQQSPFVSKFTKELFSKEFTSKEIISRAKMWVNKSLNPLYYKSLDAAAGNSRWMWVVNPVKESCPTCIKMNGQIHKMKDYVKSGILPQSPKLDCGGYQCGCSLAPSDLPSRGTFTRGRGGLRGAIRNIFQAAQSLFKR
jgi:hypothetical protein